MQASKSLGERRREICEKCPMLKMTSKHGAICNPDLWISRTTGEVSNKELPGYERGCGCKISLATEIPAHKCPVDKW